MKIVYILKQLLFKVEQFKKKIKIVQQIKNTKM